MPHTQTPSLANIVQRSLVTISQSATMTEAAALMKKRLVSGLGVVDRHEKLVGVLSSFDFMSAANRSTRVDNIMTPMLFSVDIETSVQQAAQLMVDSNLKRVFVEEKGEVIGLVTMTDIVRLVASNGIPHTPEETSSTSPMAAVLKVDRPREAFLASLERCGAQLGHVFYRNFIRSSKEISQRFAHTNMQKQEKKIMATLRLAADVIVNKPQALATLKEQAVRHSRKHLNIQPKLYRHWLEALIQTVQECDPQFNRAVEDSWRLLMGHVIQRMIKHYDL